MKKALALVLALLMAFTALQVAAFADEEEPAKYVKEVFSAKGDTAEEAKQKLTDELTATGDEFVVCDINVNYGSEKDFLYFGYTYTTNEYEAITGMVINPGFFTRYTITLNGVEYDKAVSDLNDGAGGRFVALYTTKSRLTGKLIKDIGFKVVEDSDVMVGKAEWETVKLFENLETAANLNEGTDLKFTINMTYDFVEDVTTKNLDNNFVKNIYMTKGSSEQALNELEQILVANTPEGSTYSSINMNLNAGTKSDTAIYIGCVFTKNPKEAIKGLMIGVTGTSETNSRFAYDADGRKYELV
ncbi:MAG: hypothetical protein IJL89_03440, partial [Firmicutes bacterium]|nr:hypothetical protein [Bacillota bacterium]